MLVLLIEMLVILVKFAAVVLALHSHTVQIY